MKMTVIGTTKPGYIAQKEEFDIHSGHAAGICYMPNDFQDIVNEPIEKTQRHRPESSRYRIRNHRPSGR